MRFRIVAKMCLRRHRRLSREAPAGNETLSKCVLLVEVWSILSTCSQCEISDLGQRRASDLLAIVPISLMVRDDPLPLFTAGGNRHEQEHYRLIGKGQSKLHYNV